MTSAASPAAARPDRPPRPTYAALDGWRRYQPFFPEKMRFPDSALPAEEWWDWNGLAVHLDRCAAPASPLKLIVLHGVGGYGRVVGSAAELARRHGFETVAPDLPGYGLTQVAPAQVTFPTWVDCVRALVDAELARDARPVVLFGLSLGGVLAYHAAARSGRVAGLVASTLADLREPAVRRGFARYPLLGSVGLGLLKLFAPLTDGLPLSMRFASRMHGIANDPGLAELCATDPVGGGRLVPARFLRTLLETAPDVAPEAFRLCPVLLAHPERDRMTDIAHSRRFFERLAAPKRMVVLERAGHFPIEQPGVDQLEAALVGFLREVAHPQGASDSAPPREAIANREP